MRKLTIAIPENETWLIDALRRLKAHGSCPGASVSFIARGILARELRHFRFRPAKEVALVESGYDGPNDPW
jgi:hypothetical protein